MTSDGDSLEGRRSARANWPVRRSTLKEQEKEPDRLSEDLASLPALDKTAFSVVPRFDDSDEKTYWHSRTPAERLEHMEMLRRINYGDQATARLQRVLEVVERPWR